MARRAAEVARYDALERFTYAALRGDEDAAREALDVADHSDEAMDGPSAAVRDVLVANDPVSAAAAGWLTFQELQSRVVPEPRRFLDPDEAQALADFGPTILRLVVANRLEGRSFGEALAGYRTDRRARYALAARGSVEDAEAVTALLREHGLLADDEDLGE